MRRFAAESKVAVESVSREAMDVLLKYEYPGNVRELENIVHRAVVLARGPVVTTADLPLHVAELRPEEPQPPGGFVERVAQFERELILEALERGSHAASDYYETAALSRVTTVGCRRCGGGLRGSSCCCRW